MHSNSIITGSGSFIPDKSVSNAHFAAFPFSEKDGRIIDKSGVEVVRQFENITGIRSRRYVEDQNASDIAAIAAKRAIEDAGIDRETIDLIIVSHNFGDVIEETGQVDILPSLASRVKHKLEIVSENCIPHDVIFGCPGWLQALIHANIFLKAGEAKTCLVIGTETLSKVVDGFDRDTMIFADGAGAVILERKEEENKRGVIMHSVVSHTKEEAYYLRLGKSYNPFAETEKAYIKMDGRKIYNYALTYVPDAMMNCLQKAGIQLGDVRKILLHQANEKMDEAILKRLFRKAGITEIPNDIMPMSIAELGNSSVATIPTLYDLIRRRELGDHFFKKNDHIMFASVGAGMNINAMVYKI